jgi:hypothetical protein
MSRSQLAVIHRRARGFDDLKAMIPSRTVETLVCIPMSNRRTNNATLRVGSSAALFSIGEIEIYSKLLEAEHYPNWKPRLPSEQSNPPIELDRKRLLEVIGRMTVAASPAGTGEGMDYDAGPFEFRLGSLGPVLCTLAPSSISFECRVRNETIFEGSPAPGDSRRSRVEYRTNLVCGLVPQSEGCLGPDSVRVGATCVISSTDS